MKTGGSLVGGRLIDDPKIYFSYALYLLKFVEAYEANGVHVDLISVQNEPQNRAPSGYPGTDLSSTQEEKVINYLGPMLRLAHLHTQILAYDHNWSEHPNDVANTPPDEAGDITYPQNVLSSSAARWVAGTAYHCYYGDPSAMTALHDQFPEQGHLLHRVLGQRVVGPGQHLQRHAQVGCAQPRDRLHPQLGQVGRQLEPRARPERRPARRRLRHLHRHHHRRC